MKLFHYRANKPWLLSMLRTITSSTAAETAICGLSFSTSGTICGINEWMQREEGGRGKRRDYFFLRWSSIGACNSTLMHLLLRDAMDFAFKISPISRRERRNWSEELENESEMGKFDGLWKTKIVTFQDGRVYTAWAK